MSQQDELAEIFVDEFLKTTEGQEWMEWAKEGMLDMALYRNHVWEKPDFLDEEQWERITREWNKI